MMSRKIGRRKFAQLVATSTVGTIGVAGSVQGDTAEDDDEANTLTSDGVILSGLPPNSQKNPPTIEPGDTLKKTESDSFEADRVTNQGFDNLDVESGPTGNVSGQTQRTAAGPKDTFGVVMGTPFEAKSDKLDIFIDVELEYELNPGYTEYVDPQTSERSNKTGRKSRANKKRLKDVKKQVTSKVTPESVPPAYIPIALGTANFLLGMSDKVDGYENHTGISVGYFVQNLSKETTITRNFSSESNFDITTASETGRNYDSGTARSTESATWEGFREGNEYRIGVAFGGSLSCGLWTTGSKMNFDATVETLRIDGVKR